MTSKQPNRKRREETTNHFLTEPFQYVELRKSTLTNSDPSIDIRKRNKKRHSTSYVHEEEKLRNSYFQTSDTPILAVQKHKKVG